MSKRIVSLALAALMVVCSSASYAQTAVQSEEAKAAAKVKAKIEKTGEGERVELRLRDGAKLKGSVSEIADDQFTLVDKAGGERPVRYAEIRSVQTPFNARPLKLTALVIAGVLAPFVIAGAIVSVTGDR